jgi:hypothetical protein
MASYPSIEFPNNIVSETFNKNSFVSKALQSDNILTSSLNVLGPSTLNTLQSNTINNTGNLSSNTITCTAGLSSESIVNSGALSSGSITNSGALTSNTITCTNALTASNGLTVSAGTVSFVANSISILAVNGCSSRLTTCESNITKLQNATSGIATVPTITANVLTINYSTNNNSPVLISPTANFSVVINNIPITNLNAVYRFELFITGKFYCNALTVNSTVMTLTAVGGFANIASTINASASGLIQTFNILFVNNATVPAKASTEIKATW